MHEPDPHYIRTDEVATDDDSLVLKEGESFVVLDRHGEIRTNEGLYHGGTRYLSRLTLALGSLRPLLLGAAVRSDNAAIVVHLTNPDILSEGNRGEILVPRGTLHLSHMLVLASGALHHRLRVRNHALAPVDVNLHLDFDADFADIFEVRGARRPRRGDRLESLIATNSVTLRYRGLDGAVRRTRLGLESPAGRVSPNRISFQCSLRQHGEHILAFSFTCEGEPAPRQLSFPAAVESVASTQRARCAAFCDVQTSSNQFNGWLSRSRADLSMMLTNTPHGEYPYAGVPWFSAPFGRDGLITAFETLWANPGLARGVLTFLAATQATSEDAARDAQPGKILHEMRLGEMAVLKEIPFGCYYGTHDATPLFVMLAAAYYERTNDLAFIESIWPAVEAALVWIDRHGDLDSDGFIEYARQSPEGLVQQGWKDSHDSMFHTTGELASPPIAPCEIQAYVYGAFRGAAQLAAVLGEEGRAAGYARRGDALFESFNQHYWHDGMGSYVLALDGTKRACAVRSSNAGHALFAGVVPAERAGLVVKALMAPESFSGWGIRTVATSEARYNPMAYHNGSVWPHDNAIIAAGFARYGFRDEAVLLLDAIFHAALGMDHYRLPELFCGFGREPGEGPIWYPAACSPQAWASASAFLLLQSALGLEIDGAKRLVQFRRPKLPSFLRDVSIRGLQVADEFVDLLLRKEDGDVRIEVLRKSTHVEVVTVR